MGQTTRIILTGGGSGGHIIPLLSLARALKDKDPSVQLIYIGLKGEKIELSDKRFDVFDQTSFITSGKFRRYHGESLLSHLLDIKTLLLNLRDVFKVLWGTAVAFWLLGRYRPAVVFSKGGYVVVPVGMAARLRGITIITHDSDAVPGLANRIIGRWAQLHATGLPPQYYPYPKDTVVHTGIPVDERVKSVDTSLQKKLKKQIDLPPDCLMLLVAGGGLGSQKINELAVEISDSLLEANPKLQIVHFSGSGHQDQVAEHYMRKLGKEMPDRVKVLGFSSDFYAYSGAADVMLARAGATTIAELAIQRKTAVIIPSPFLSGGHQLKNAEELTTKEAAVVLPNDVSPQKLLSVLNELLQNEQRRASLAHNISRLAHPDAASRLAELLLSVAKPKKN